MILYDRYPGGLGYSERGYQHIDRLLGICLEMDRDCPCDEGCPNCVGLPNLRPAIHSDPDLMRGHPLPNKQATIRLLELLCEPPNQIDGAEFRRAGAAIDGNA
jgi:DEAD/DEAH box helicase domain-containing protein